MALVTLPDENIPSLHTDAPGAVISFVPTPKTPAGGLAMLCVWVAFLQLCAIFAAAKLFQNAVQSIHESAYQYLLPAGREKQHTDSSLVWAKLQGLRRIAVTRKMFNELIDDKVSLRRLPGDERPGVEVFEMLHVDSNTLWRLEFEDGRLSAFKNTALLDPVFGVSRYPEYWQACENIRVIGLAAALGVWLLCLFAAVNWPERRKVFGQLMIMAGLAVSLCFLLAPRSGVPILPISRMPNLPIGLSLLAFGAVVRWQRRH